MGYDHGPQEIKFGPGSLCSAREPNSSANVKTWNADVGMLEPVLLRVNRMEGSVTDECSYSHAGHRLGQLMKASHW